MHGSDRRNFLKFSAGAGAAIIGMGAGLDLDLSKAFAQRGVGASGPVSLGSGDIAILNFAYALEQLEAAFYSIVVARPYPGMVGFERQVLIDIRNHEVAHREFFRRTLGPNGIPDLSFNFAAVNFASRDSVLTTARTFEDLGVAAYNGAGQFLRDPNNLAAAGRIVSVEGRHAAILRDIIAPLSSNFAGDDVVNLLGLDVRVTPAVAQVQASPYIQTPIFGAPLLGF